MNQLEKVLNFKGNEIKVKTDQGVELFNLVNSAKCCGLIRNKNNIRWDDVKKKLNTIYSSIETLTPQYIEEIEYVLNEIENADDRKSIYMSRYLTSRLAMECHSEKANAYKDWLAKLDEAYSNNQLTSIDNQELINITSNLLNQMMPTLATEISTKILPHVIEAKQSVENMRSLMCDQSAIYDEERKELKSMIGMRSKNVKSLTDKLKYELQEHYGEYISANDTFYVNAKDKLFKEYRVQRWEQIPVEKYNAVFASIEVLFEE